MKRLVAFVVVLIGLCAVRAGAAPAINSAVNTRIKDFRASATLDEANLEALKKIGSDYANAYRAKTMETYFKEPGKLRFEAKAVGITFTQVVNNNTIFTSVLGIKRTRDISRLPQARQTSMEIGFITPNALRDFTARHTGTQRLAGRTLQVYELRYKQADQRGKKVVLWVDVARKVLARRYLYHGDGRLKARFEYSNPQQVASGIWVPRRIAVYNAEGQFGGVTHYSNIRVNTGLDDALFEGF
ncbi:MAG: outer membrane lipoprotein-sorting protein [Armatimonadetes bacterium]|nr:outer membrane lipoprotein-sorting protein [Armatimonadota bacterium]